MATPIASSTGTFSSEMVNFKNSRQKGSLDFWQLCYRTPRPIMAMAFDYLSVEDVVSLRLALIRDIFKEVKNGLKNKSHVSFEDIIKLAIWTCNDSQPAETRRAILSRLIRTCSSAGVMDLSVGLQAHYLTHRLFTASPPMPLSKVYIETSDPDFDPGEEGFTFSLIRADCEALASLAPRLTNLTIRTHRSISTGSCGPLKALNLSRLCIEDTRIEDGAVFSCFGDMRYLKDLSLNGLKGTDIERTNIAYYQGTTSLSRLKLAGALQAWHLTPFIHCRDLQSLILEDYGSDEQPALTMDAVLSCFSQASCLTQLTLFGIYCDRISEEDCSHLTSLRDVHFSIDPLTTNNILNTLLAGSRANIESIKISKCDIADDICNNFSGYLNLRQVDLEAVKVKSDCETVFESMSQGLKECLSLSKLRINIDARRYAHKTCLNDKMLALFSSCKQLIHFSIEICSVSRLAVTKGGIDKLRRSLPNLQHLGIVDPNLQELIVAHPDLLLTKK